MISTLVQAWGHWPLFVGLALALAVQAYRAASADPGFAVMLAPYGWDRVPARLRPLIPVGFAGLAAASAALVGGADWAAAGDAALTVWGSALVGADALRLALGKPASPAEAPPATADRGAP